MSLASLLLFTELPDSLKKKSLSCTEPYRGDFSALWRWFPVSVHSGPASVFIQELVSAHPCVSLVLCGAAFHPFVNAFLLQACLHTLKHIFTAPLLSMSVTSHGNLENHLELTLMLLEHLLSVFLTLMADDDEDVTGLLSLRLGFERFSSTLPMNEKTTSLSSCHFCFPHTCLRWYNAAKKVSVRRPTDQSESSGEP